MVERQISARGVSDAGVLEAMRKVERHLFIPGSRLAEAYEDYPLPLGHGQTISQPYIVALMTELCSLTGAEKVLEVGTGSGYQTAILSLLAGKVYSIECVEALAVSAKIRLSQLGFPKTVIKYGDGYEGWEDEAPFDVIILTAAPSRIPETLLRQLKDPGILVAPIGNFSQELVRVSIKSGQLHTASITGVRFVPMVHIKKDKT